MAAYWSDRDLSGADIAEFDRRIAAFRAAKRKLAAAGWRERGNASGWGLGERADSCDLDELEREAEAILARGAMEPEMGTGDASTTTSKGEDNHMIAVAEKHEHETGPSQPRVARNCPVHGEHFGKTGCVRCKAEKRRANAAARGSDRPGDADPSPRRKWSPETSNRLARLNGVEGPDRLAAMVTTLGTEDVGLATVAATPPVAEMPTVARPAAATPPSTAPWSAEPAAMLAIGEALAPLDGAARRRVLAWAADALGSGVEDGEDVR